MAGNNDNLLHQTESGYVMRCGCCQEIQIGFGNMIFKNDYPHFLQLKNCIDGIDFNQPFQGVLPNHKQFVLKMPGGIAAGFTRAEILEFRYLLNKADAAIQVNNLLDEIGC